jgi:SAM-dependent methyltransferase
LNYFEAYGEAAARIADPTIAAGRYPFQSDDQPNMVKDVIDKLELPSVGRLLEIGFGSGQLLRPLAELVGEAAGVDHIAAVTRLVGQLPPHVSLVAGRWPDVRPSGKFDRILIYSVLQYLGGRDTARQFIDAAVEVLADGGLLLIGDLPNRDAVRRFSESAFGQQFTSSWRRQVAECESSDVRVLHEIFARAARTEPFIDDDFILTLVADYRRAGLDAYTLPQPLGLPFCHTREDLLVRRRPA